MLKRILTYVLLILVVFQTSIAMGDTHQSHQSGADHVVFDETHEHPRELTLEIQHEAELDLDSASSQKWDCHHCCHCHGHFCPVILLSTERVLLSTSASLVTAYSENAIPDTFETFLRPPKA